MRHLVHTYMICILVIAVLFVLFTLQSWHPAPQSTLSSFIVGRWVPKADVGNMAWKGSAYQFEFLKSGKFILSGDIGEMTVYNTVYEYEFIDEDQIRLVARGGYQLKIERRGDYLFVTETTGLIEVGQYERRPPIQWQFVTLLVGMIPLSLFLLMVNQPFTRKQVPTSRPLLLFRTKLAKSMIIWLFRSLSFVFGLVFAYEIPYFEPIRWIRLPWDALIILEMSATSLLLALLFWPRINETSDEALALGLPFLSGLGGSFFVGCSVTLLFRGLLNLVVFTVFGSYSGG